MKSQVTRRLSGNEPQRTPQNCESRFGQYNSEDRGETGDSQIVATTKRKVLQNTATSNVRMSEERKEEVCRSEKHGVEDSSAN